MLHHEISGNGKKPLVLLHGFMENTTIWEEMEAHLSKDFTLIKIDLPGHGKSKVYQEIHTVELMAEKVKEVIDFLKLEKINLLGHSLGGYVSLAFSEKFPEILESMTLFFSTTVTPEVKTAGSNWHTNWPASSAQCRSPATPAPGIRNKGGWSGI